MFLVRHWENGSTAVSRLDPKPTWVDYPPINNVVIEDALDGHITLNRPLIDGEPRSWVWSTWRTYMEKYMTQWRMIRNLEYLTRIENGIPDEHLTIELWENVTGNRVFNKTTDGLDPDLDTYTNIDWVEVKVLQVTEDLDTSTGRVAHSNGVLEFALV